MVSSVSFYYFRAKGGKSLAQKDSPAPGAVKGLVAEAWLRRALQKEKGIVGGT